MKIVVLDRSSVGEDVSVEAIKQFGEVDFYNSTPGEDDLSAFHRL